ncbi:MAG: hypothetical protein A2027_04210 [Thermodesulfovibrio sp. RBG_19FT_COMBO_41_18]|nr:MAG: hypothetical protein A2027_04210 [Thermodesulfovibrio sp. RBG_19FT_COMBO_41_18]
MFISHHMKRLLTTSLLSFVILSLSTTNVFAGDLDNITWNSLLPEESNISLQQKQVMKGLEVTMEELNSVIDRELKNNTITNDTDFTVNEDVALVYDYLMYRIFELIKVDNKIREELLAQEVSFRNNDVSMDMVKKHFSIKEDYENKEASFFTLVDKLRLAVYIKDLRAEVRNVQHSLKDLTTAMNRYSSYRNRLASR